LKGALIAISGILLIVGGLIGCMEVPAEPVIDIDPETGIATVRVPEWKPSVAETIKTGAEIGLSALEQILIGGGSLAGVLAAVFGVPKAVKAKKAANEKKKVELAKEIAKANKELNG
jgi:hypothetical protein